MDYHSIMLFPKGHYVLGLLKAIKLIYCVVNVINCNSTPSLKWKIKSG